MSDFDSAPSIENDGADGDSRAIIEPCSEEVAMDDKSDDAVRAKRPNPDADAVQATDEPASKRLKPSGPGPTNVKPDPEFVLGACLQPCLFPLRNDVPGCLLVESDVCMIWEGGGGGGGQCNTAVVFERGICFLHHPHLRISSQAPAPVCSGSRH